MKSMGLHRPVMKLQALVQRVPRTADSYSVWFELFA